MTSYIITVFLESTIAVRHNAVKSVIFRVAALLLQIAIIKLFSFLAALGRAFTSYLMFAEDYFQRIYFVISRKLVRGSLLVLFFTVLYLLAGFYDTMLWSLDRPGYISKTQSSPASYIKESMLENPAYVISYRSGNGEVKSLNESLADIMGANLYRPGLNFTLTETIDRGTKKAVPQTPTRTFIKTGPRIWLDGEGFSVSPDFWVAVSPVEGGSCPWTQDSPTTVSWKCERNNSYAFDFAQYSVGWPIIAYDDKSDMQGESQYIKPEREDNLWNSLGTGGNTALMILIFSVTKGRQRHTFALTAFKATMVTKPDAPFADHDIDDMVRRTWSNQTQLQDKRVRNALDTVSKNIMHARDRNVSFLHGVAAQDGPHSVLQSHYEFLNVEGGGTSIVSMLRISAVNISIIRSDALAEPVQPFEPCSGSFFQNIATGGKVRRTTCVTSAGGNDSGGHFLGEVDSASTFILTGVLGDGTSNISSKALNQSALKWVVDQRHQITNLVVARGFILGLDPALVTVDIAKLEAAISYLQVLLVLVPIILAIGCWVMVHFGATSHYSCSLLQTLCATTTVSGEGDHAAASRKPKYLLETPEFELREMGPQGAAVAIATTTGVFRHQNLDENGVAAERDVFLGDWTA